ncbi:MAG: CPBP family intramembrane metalloprotease [Candidatus Omnitrophica bacterium]|nr:CPBP family intramembrane metalloprotease [Candidatus Omnitrophota bacterium]
MSKISTKTWLIFLGLSFFSVLVWKQFTAPQLSFINLSVSKNSALKIASTYLTEKSGIQPADLKSYHSAIVFTSRDTSDQYLQKAIGFKKELEYFKEHDFELFYWTIRFFKENQKEEYRVTVSAGSGEVTAYSHVIEASAFRPPQTEDEAREKAIAFLKEKFNFDPALWAPQTNNSQKYERRTDFSFAWEKSDSKVFWSKEPDTGWAIISTGVSVSGDEILGFYKNNLKIPDQYQRYMDKIQNVGRNLSTLFRICFYFILTAAIFHVLLNRNSIVMHSVKKFGVALTGCIFAAHIASYFNSFQSIIFNYPTTSSMSLYIWQNIVSVTMDTFITVLTILMPFLAGEAIHRETFPERKEGAFLHYLRSTFFSRNVTGAILIGYLSAVIMIGIQTLAFEFGQKYLGVWTQYSWMAQLSDSYSPLLAAFIIGVTAGFSEEICFRLFGINIDKKFMKNTFLACLIASVVWGYGHSGYLVFPMWFRGLEVTLMGLFLSYVYLRFGIIPVITAHYLFDVFWDSSAYLLGQAPATDFYASLTTLLLPLAFATVAFVMNKKVAERPLRWHLNIHQLFNLEVLKDYLQRHNLLAKKSAEQLKHEIAAHGWDLSVVEMAIEDLTAKKNTSHPEK